MPRKRNRNAKPARKRKIIRNRRKVAKRNGRKRKAVKKKPRPARVYHTESGRHYILLGGKRRYIKVPKGGDMLEVIRLIINAFKEKQAKKRPRRRVPRVKKSVQPIPKHLQSTASSTMRDYHAANNAREKLEKAESAAERRMAEMSAMKAIVPYLPDGRDPTNAEVRTALENVGVPQDHPLFDVLKQDIKKKQGIINDKDDRLKSAKKKGKQAETKASELEKQQARAIAEIATTNLLKFAESLPGRHARTLVDEKTKKATTLPTVREWVLKNVPEAKKFLSDKKGKRYRPKDREFNPTMVNNTRLSYIQKYNLLDNPKFTKLYGKPKPVILKEEFIKSSEAPQEPKTQSRGSASAGPPPAPAKSTPTKSKTPKTPAQKWEDAARDIEAGGDGIIGDELSDAVRLFEQTNESRSQENSTRSKSFVPEEGEQSNMASSDQSNGDDVVDDTASYYSTNGSGKKGKGLSDTQINKMMARYPKFAGAYAADEMHLIPIKKQFGFIINTNPRRKGDGHWVAVWIDCTKDKSIEYYDPFGEDPSKTFMKGLKPMIDALDCDTYLKFKVNRIANQRATSGNCGFHSMAFLIRRMKGDPFIEVSGYSDFKRGAKDVKMVKKQFKKFDFV